MDNINNASAYLKAEAYICDIPRFAGNCRFSNTGVFLDYLGNPGQNKKVIHIAGTNGKGSVCAYLNAFLSEAGYAVGMFTSPHLVTMRERFRVRGKTVSETVFAEAFEAVKSAVETVIKQKGLGHPTFFEFLFLMGMLIFEEAGTEYIILETGMGGRLDATNSIQKPVLTAITRIGLDHCRYLGDTIELIAGEKAGIIKQGVPVLYTDTNDKVSDIIRETAAAMDSYSEKVEKGKYLFIKNTNKNIDFSYKSRYYGYIRFTVPSAALYQMENIALALTAAEYILPKQQCPAEAMQRAVANTKWEGRMEEVLPGIYVDGAHNEDGIAAFLDTVRQMKTKGKRILLFSVAADKDYQSMIAGLLTAGLFDLVCVTAMEGERAASMKILRAAFSQYKNISLHFAEDVPEGLKLCLREHREEDLVYVVGSLYLVGLVKRHIKEEIR